MKRQKIEAWATALESGKYRQGRERLITRNGSLCCLGVAACAVLGETKEGILYKQELSLEQLDSLGLSNADQIALMRVNDAKEGSAHMNFKEIALGLLLALESEVPVKEVFNANNLEQEYYDQ